MRKIQMLSIALFALMFLSNVVFASPAGAASLEKAAQELSKLICNLLSSIVLILVVLAALAYTAGHVMGSETGARAKVWAQNMILGAVIGLIIYAAAPFILQQLLPTGSVSPTC